MDQDKVLEPNVESSNEDLIVRGLDGDQLEEIVDDALSYLYLSDKKEEKDCFKGVFTQSINDFGDALFLDYPLVGKDDDWFLFDDTKESDLANLHKYSITSFLHENAGGGDAGIRYQVSQVRLLTGAERRKISDRAQYIVCLDAALMHIDGTYSSYRTYWRKEGGKYRNFNPFRHSMMSTEDRNPMIRAHFGMIYRSHFCWHVSLGYGDGPGLKFECTPQGAAEVFRLRDIPEGKNRRSAIKHWVKEHRRIREGKVSSVIAHLRGAETFIWNGMRCTIAPAQSDIDMVTKEKLRKSRSIGV